MPELRKDPILDTWVIIATERARRPSDFPSENVEPGPGPCPFCEGHETKTPPETYAIRPDGGRPNSPGWKVRVVSNKYPALAIEGNLDRRGLGMFDRMNGIGAHEVIIESPSHQSNFADSPVEEINYVLTAYRERLLDLSKDTRFRYLSIFRNYGAVAGASLEHPHSQLIAVAITPKNVRDKLTVARTYFLEKERCVFCDIIKQEQAMRDRVVWEDQHFLVLSPFAARFPFELSIYPRRHSHDFTQMTSDESWALAGMLKRALMRMKEVLNNPPYNYLLQTCPNPIVRPGHPDYWGTLAQDFHWHIDIMPRLTKVAGFEWATGFYINPMPPEAAATCLREGEAE